MTAQEVAENLGHMVRFRCPRLYIDGEYKLTAYILRKDDRGRKIASVELTDSEKRTLIVKMDEVSIE